MKKNIENEFNDFLNSSNETLAQHLSEKVSLLIHEKMSFSILSVIAKLSVFHLLSTAAILYICPQFGISWGASSVSLTSFFMKLGHELCAGLCGVTLVGGSFLLTALILKPQESFWLKKQMPWIPISLSILTLLALAAMGAQAHHTEFVFWSVFGILGGCAAFEIGRRWKLYSFRFLSRLAF